MFLSVDGGRSRISDTTSQGGPPLTFLSIDGVCSRISSTVSQGPTIYILQLSGSHSHMFWQCLPGGHYEHDVFSVKFFWVLTLLRTWRDNCQTKKFKIAERGAEELVPPVGSQHLLRWARGHSQYPADWVPLHTSFKLRQGAERAPMRVPCAMQHQIQPPSHGRF
jgi:hypothetical protein